MATVSAKSVRKQLESIQGCSYNDKKKEIDALIMEVYQSLDESSSEDEPLSNKTAADEDPDYESYVMKPSPSKRKSSSKQKGGDKISKKRKTQNSSSTGRGAPNNGFMKPLKLSPAIQVLTRSNEDEVSCFVHQFWLQVLGADHCNVPSATQTTYRETNLGIYQRT
jgi:hypothetical protein